MARQRLLAEPNGLRILNLNCWNEWTEGSYLEPDKVHGMAHLNAIKAVFLVPKINTRAVRAAGFYLAVLEAAPSKNTSSSVK